MKTKPLLVIVSFEVKVINASDAFTSKMEFLLTVSPDRMATTGLDVLLPAYMVTMSFPSSVAKIGAEILIFVAFGVEMSQKQSALLL